MLKLRKTEKLELAPQKKKKSSGLLLGLLLAALVLGGAYAFKLYHDGRFTEPPARPEQVKPLNAGNSGPSEQRDQTGQASQADQAAQAGQARQQSPLGGVGVDDELRQAMKARSETLTLLLADKEILEAQAKNARLEKEIAELAVPVLPVLPAPADAASVPAQTISLPLIRSISGLDSRLSAVLVLNGAVRAVRKGESFGGGTVEQIHAYGVDFRTEDGTIHILSFED